MTAARSAVAQLPIPPVTIGMARQVNTNGQNWAESTVGASQINENEVVVLCYDGFYGVSTNGGSTIVNGVFSESTPDPFIACGPGSGKMWIGWINPGTYGVGLTYKLAGETQLGLHQTYHPSVGDDKPSMCIGPIPGNLTVQREHLLFNYREVGMGTCAIPNGIGSFSDAFIDPPDPFPGTQPVWTRQRVKPDSSSHESDYEGWGITGVVLSDGVVVAAARDARRVAGSFVYNEGRPYVVRSVDGGYHWQPDLGVPTRLVGFPPIQANMIGGGSAALGDTSYWIDRRNSAPSIARDPNNDTIYVAFAARAEATNSTEGNSDLYVFRSLNGGLTFLNQNAVHLTDAMLGIPAGQLAANGPDQVMPAIAVDCQGAVNIVYYDARNDLSGTPYSHDLVDVYYSRITDFGLATMAVTTVRFTPTSFSVAGPGMLGDYMTLAAAGPSSRVLYSAHVITVPDGVGGWKSEKSCFLRKIIMNQCPPGGGGNFTAGEADTILGAIVAGAPEGDILEDESVDFDDLELLVFWCESTGVW
ncbi:MAG: hypothetical protein AABZ53_02030 [Planctomycetota bacterium]